MPDVGVLQLRISADASNAARSLKTLQTRLSEINQIAQTFNLSNVATQIGDIVKQVSSDKATSTAVKNLGSLLNAISAFSKVTKLGLNKSQIEQISALQSAVSGFNLGQSGTQLNKLREALGGEWNTEQASKVRDALVTMSGGAKTLTDSGTANTIKETAKAVEQMSSGAANEIKTASAEMENFGQTTGNTANILDRLGSLQSSIFGRIPSHYMSMQGSVLNETAGFAESERQIKEVSVVAKDATTDMQNLKSASEETASSIENIDISRMVQEVEQAATYMALADKDVASGIDEANSRLEEQLRLRREALDAENQARLESNYQNYRELFLSKEGEWEKQVPEMYGFTPKALQEGETYADAMKITMQEVNEYVDQFIDKMNTPSGPLLKDSIDDMLGIGRAAKSAEESAKALQYAPEIKEATQEVQTAVAGMANSMTKSQTATRVLGDNLKDLDGELKEKKSDIKDVTNETKSMTARFSELMVGSEGLGGSFKRMFPAISGLLGRFKQLVKYRMLRAIIRQIAKAFKEGTENYYHYSQAIGGTFAPAMDNATSALLQMKNSIGAAAAPVIQALIPYLQMAVNWFITAINYANQFFALLGGQTSWSRAVPQTAKAFDKVKKSAGGAGAAMKDLLADWDELNIIQSESGGGGGGGGAAAMEDYLNMFEESSIFDERIKEIVNFIKENFDDILSIVKKIGAALLLWKVSSAIGGILGTLAGLAAAGLTAAIVFEVTTLFTKQYLNTGDIGWLIADLLTTMIGAFFMKKILTAVLGGSVGQLAIPITLTVSAVAGIITILGNNDVSALSEEALIASAENGLKAAFAAGYLLKNVAGYSLGQAAAGGLGIGITTFGLVIGLKAVADTLNTKEFTSEIVKADFLSAGLVGTGIAITELALGGGAAAALTLGGGAALLTLGALFGVEALLVLSKEEDPIKWGDYDATEEEIRAFIDEKVFSGSPKVKIDLAKATIEPLGENKAKLEEETTKVIGTLQSVKLGLSTSAEADLTSDLTSFISTFNQTSKNYQDALKVSVNLVPVSNLEDGGESIVANSESRWNELNGIMQGLADDLTKQFDIAYNSDLDEVTKKNAEASIEKISKMMVQIADAVSSGQAQAKVVHSINTQIDNLIHSDMDEMLAYYEEQRDQLIAELVSVGNDAAEGVLAQYYAYEKLAEYALQDAGGNIEDETYKHYTAQAEAALTDYKDRLEKLNEDAERIANETLGDTEGVKKIKETLINKLTKVLPTDAEEILASGGVGDIDIYRKFIEGLLQEIVSGETDVSALKTEMNDLFWGIVYDLVGGENIDTYIKAVEDGIITYAELFGDIDVASLITEALGISNSSPEIQAMWAEVINSLFPDKPIQIPDKPIKIDAKSFENGLVEGAQSSITNIPISPDLLLKDPVVNKSETFDEETRNKVREALSNAWVGKNDDEFDAVQHELAGIYGAGLVDSVLEELESGITVEEMPAIDVTQPVDVMIDQEIKNTSGDQKKALENIMTYLFPDSNADLLNRPVLDYGDYFETLFTNTITAGKEAEAEIPWNADIVMNLTPIMPDGTKLTDNELREYVQDLLGGSSSISELFWNDSVENGGKGLLINILDEFDSLDEGITKAVELAQKLHELQELYYGGSGESGGGGGGAPSYYANMGASVMQGINATFANMKNILPWMSGSSDVTVKETRDSGEEIGNTAEGTRQGTSEIVTGQNTMNGYMQQVAMSTAGMVDSQGTANSYMAQMVSLLRTIASQGGGAAPAAQSVMGGMVAGALAAFEAVRG